jgi:predicted DNA-binding antitoxin AbrB/MazE fold protein
MSVTTFTVTATFEDGVLRPDRPLPLAPQQRVTLVVQISEAVEEWPEDVAEIYREIAEEDRTLMRSIGLSVP